MTALLWACRLSTCASGRVGLQYITIHILANQATYVLLIVIITSHIYTYLGLGTVEHYHLFGANRLRHAEL